MCGARDVYIRSYYIVMVSRYICDNNWSWRGEKTRLQRVLIYYAPTIYLLYQCNIIVDIPVYVLILKYIYIDSHSVRGAHCTSGWLDPVKVRHIIINNNIKYYV